MIPLKNAKDVSIWDLNAASKYQVSYHPTFLFPAWPIVLLTKYYLRFPSYAGRGKHTSRIRKLKSSRPHMPLEVGPVIHRPLSGKYPLPRYYDSLSVKQFTSDPATVPLFRSVQPKDSWPIQHVQLFTILT